MDGTVVLYVGGIAELFKTSREAERLFLSERKGFIKLALRSGVDIIPIYLFGNTSILSAVSEHRLVYKMDYSLENDFVTRIYFFLYICKVKNDLLANLSRRMQVSLTVFWGKYFLPIPRDDKLLYVSAPPMGLPQIENPTQDDIDFWHAKYCEEITRLFKQYKERVPAYKHKKLFID